MMITTLQELIFQKEWTGSGERGVRDFVIIPAIFFGAISPGLYLAALFTGYLPGLWAAIFFNLAGYGLSHMLFLGRMDRFWRALINWKTSWLSRGFIFNALFTGAGILYALSVTFNIPRLSGPEIITILKPAAILGSVLFAVYPGFMLLVVKTIPFWHSFLEPVIFFLQGLVGGTAAELLLLQVVPQETVSSGRLVTVNFFLAGLLLILLSAGFLFKALSGGAERASVEYLFTGSFSKLFVTGALVLGLLLPLFLFFLALVLKPDFYMSRELYILVSSLEISGIYIGKYGILKAGIYSPLND